MKNVYLLRILILQGEEKGFVLLMNVTKKYVKELC